MHTFYLAWLLALTVVTFAVFRYDKRQAAIRGATRVREAWLLALLLVGGFVGGSAAMYMRPRHKTRKPIFVLMLAVSVLLHAYLLSVLYRLSE